MKKTLDSNIWSVSSTILTFTKSKFVHTIYDYLLKFSIPENYYNWEMVSAARYNGEKIEFQHHNL